ncbi:restriction endonuclease subunit S [Thermogemmatispora onikobensis]|uniref:restriction endonuclease subunit S n=1 Tax=Thermogemmatispora onikobensis TaxID=732234 RepID=UPI0008530BBC
MAAIERHLTRLDAVVETLRRDRIKLKNARAALLRDAVEGKLTEGWRASHPVSEDGQALLRRILAERRARWEAEQLEKMRARGQEPRDDRWKQAYREPAGPDTSTLPPLPPGWCWATVEQLITQLSNGLSQMPSSDPRGYKILRISAVRPMSVDLSQVRYLSLPPDEATNFTIENGDLLFTRYNGSLDFLGIVGVVRKCFEAILYPDKIIRAKATLGEPLVSYLEFAINTGISRFHIESRSRTTAGQRGISGSDIKQTPIPLPPLEEQRQIVAEVERRLTIIQQAEEAIERSLKRAERLRQSILKRAFSGQLVPQDPRDEPASQLLERIQAERARRQREKEGRRPGQRRSRMGAGPGDPSLSGGGPGGVVGSNPQPPEPLDPQQLARPSLWEAESDTGGGEGRSQT